MVSWGGNRGIKESKSRVSLLQGYSVRPKRHQVIPMIGPTWLVGVSISVHLVNRSRLCCGPFSSTEFAKCAFCAGDRAASVASETWDEQKATSCTILLHPFNIETHRNTSNNDLQSLKILDILSFIMDL